MVFCSKSDDFGHVVVQMCMKTQSSRKEYKETFENSHYSID